MDYSKFGVKDFLADDYFLRWVNQHDPEAEKFWHLLLSVHPELKPKIDQARALVLNLKLAEHAEFSPQQIDQMWADIDKQISQPKSPVKTKQSFINWSYRIAASLLLLALSLGVFLYSDKADTNINKDVVHYTDPSTDDYVEEINTTQNPIRIHLSDGSIVKLEKGSRLKYKNSYDGEDSRRVFLTGEAFFDVSKNPKQPFFVHANEVVTKVLGTSFCVRAYQDDEDITVAVKHGKVSVFSPKKSNANSGDVHSEVNGVILLPNQQVVYQRDQELFDKTLVTSPLVLSPVIKKSDFTFENAPIANVFNVLADAYGIEIIFDEEVMKTCYLTAPLGDEPLFEKLRIVCRTIGASYEIMDAKVVINSSGCL